MKSIISVRKASRPTEERTDSSNESIKFIIQNVVSHYDIIPLLLMPDRLLSLESNAWMEIKLI